MEGKRLEKRWSWSDADQRAEGGSKTNRLGLAQVQGQFYCLACARSLMLLRLGCCVHKVGKSPWLLRTRVGKNEWLLGRGFKTGLGG